MPIYEYQCKACGHHLEVIQGFNDKPLKECPECYKPKLAKLVSAPSFHLKGTGWYVTDFKDSGKKEKKEKVVKDDNVKTEGKKTNSDAKTSVTESAASAKKDDSTTT